MEENIIPRDILQKIGSFIDYKSFISLLSTNKTYYDKKNYLVPIIYDTIEYTNFGQIHEKFFNAIEFMLAGNNQYLKSMYQIIPTVNIPTVNLNNNVNLDNNIDRTYIDFTSISSFDRTFANLKNAKIPAYSISNICSIVSQFVQIVVMNEAFCQEIIEVGFTKIIFKINANVEIICCADNRKFPNDIIIDIMQIIPNYDRVHKSQLLRQNTFKYKQYIQAICFCILTVITFYTGRMYQNYKN